MDIDIFQLEESVKSFDSFRFVFPERSGGLSTSLCAEQGTKWRTQHCFYAE